MGNDNGKVLKKQKKKSWNFTIPGILPTFFHSKICSRRKFWLIYHLTFLRTCCKGNTFSWNCIIFSHFFLLISLKNAKYRRKVCFCCLFTPYAVLLYCLFTRILILFVFVPDIQLEPRPFLSWILSRSILDRWSPDWMRWLWVYHLYLVLLLMLS